MVFSPFGWLGEKAAEADISDVSLGILDIRQKNKESKPELNISPGDIVSGVAGNLTSAALDGGGVLTNVAIPNPMSAVISFGTAGGKVQTAHKELIAELAVAGAPGFIHQVIKVNGKPVEVWIDASGVAEGDNTPTVYMEGDKVALGDNNDKHTYNQKKDSLESTVDKLKDNAVAQVQDYMKSQERPYTLMVQDLSDGITPLDMNSSKTLTITPSVLEQARQAVASADISAGKTVTEAGASCAPNAKGACVTPDRSH